MKHLDVRRCCLQDELKSGNYTVNSVDRKFNASDMLTHSPSAEELRRFIPMLGSGLPHSDGEEARLQRCQHDVGTSACCQTYRISHEYRVFHWLGSFSIA